MQLNRAVVSYRALGVALCVAGTLLGGSAAPAVARDKPSNAQEVYQIDRVACLAGKTHQDRATCLREAAAALQEARRGRLDDGRAEFERNRLARCEKQPLEDREYCVRRMKGEGITSGSVEGGGIYRELVVPVGPSQRN